MTEEEVEAERLQKLHETKIGKIYKGGRDEPRRVREGE